MSSQRLAFFASLTLPLFATLIGCDGSPASGGEVPSFEEFRQQHYEASLGEYVMQGDLTASESELRAYYEQLRATVEPAKEGDPAKLVVAYRNGTNVKWPSNLASALSYCIDEESFGEDADTMRLTMVNAAAAWTNHSNYQVQIYQKRTDKPCDANNEDVVFNVVRHKFTRADILAASFWPDDPRSKRQIRVSKGVEGDVSVLTHELGHTLGFRHENNRDSQNVRTTTSGCGWEDAEWAALTPLDNGSIMNCETNGVVEPSDQDILGMQCLYPAANDAERLLPLCFPNGLYYRAHLGQLGWLGYVNANDVGGYADEDVDHRLEALQVRVNSPKAVNICVTVHVAELGWLPEVCGGDTAGTTGQGHAIEALSMRVDNGPAGCSISYNTNIVGRGWQSKARDGEVQGVTGVADVMNAVRIELSPQCF